MTGRYWIACEWNWIFKEEMGRQDYYVRNLEVKIEAGQFAEPLNFLRFIRPKPFIAINPEKL